jgi:hypothetical protein
MKKLILGAWLFQVVLVAAPQELLKDEAGVTHFMEEIETPTPVKKKLLTSLNWRTRSNGFEEEIDQTGVILDKLVNLGKKVWSVIEKGKPVVTVRSEYANALPEGVRASELEHFSPLQFRSVRHYGVNLYGITVYDVTYTLVHRFGGSYQGQGSYLESVTVLPQEVEVVWGYQLDLNVESVSIANLGDRENPIASIAMETSLRVGTIMKELRLRNLHEFRGDSATVRSTELP